MEKQYVTHLTKRMRENASPGPGKYNISTGIGDVPAIKFKGRHYFRPDNSKVPYYNPPSSFGKTTPIRIGPKTNRSDSTGTPGPTYVPPPFGQGSRGCTFSSLERRGASKGSGSRTSRRRKNPDETPGPGPGKYNTRTHDFNPDKSGKGVKIKGAHNFKYHISDSPGPAYRPRHECVLPSAPKIAFHIRPETKTEVYNPPYRNIRSELGGPKFTIKSRATDEIYMVG